MTTTNATDDAAGGATDGATGDSGLRTEQRGPVLWLTLDRPHRRNAVTTELARALRDELRRAGDDAGVRAIVLTGTGPHFCAGADLGGAIPQAPGADGHLLAGQQASRPFYDLVEALWLLETPLVTALNGGMFGLGLIVGLLGDLVIGVPGAPVAQMFTRRGLPAHAGDPFLLPRVLPFRRVMELSLLGERFTTDDLLLWGAINAIVDLAELPAEADRLARRLADGPTVALKLSKRLYRRSLETDLRTSLAEDMAALALSKSTRDSEEGIAAFVERRDPRFIGS